VSRGMSSVTVPRSRPAVTAEQSADRSSSAETFYLWSITHGVRTNVIAITWRNRAT
jgi:hypothetical protein